MAKSLAQYRDEARKSLGDDEIFAAFPIWFVSAPGVRRRANPTGLVAGLLQVLAPAIALVAAIAGVVVGVFRHARSEGGPTAKAELSGDTGSVLFVLRSTHIDVHNFRVFDRFAGAHLLTLNPADHPVRVVKVHEQGETTVAFGHTEWTVRRQHAAAFLQQIEALGYRIAPDEL